MSYQENILQAVDMVVSQRLHEMSFDKTIVCRVENDENAKKGEYTVSYQAMTMVVYAANPEEEYKKGQDVYVTVPQGDFNLRKIIIGYVSPSEIPTYLYTNPMKYLVKLSDNLIADKTILNSENLSAAATNNSITLRDYSEEGNMPPIKYLCFAADFFTSGTIDYTKKYGIKIIGKGTLKEDKEQKKDFEWIFDSTQFQGNPYAFNGLFRQEQLFDIEKYSELNDLTIKLFKEDNNFSVIVSNIELVYGYAKDDLTKDNIYDKIILYEKNAKEIYPQYETDWQLNFATQIYEDQQIKQPGDYYYKWFIYDQQASDVGNGRFWARILKHYNGDSASNETKETDFVETSQQILTLSLNSELDLQFADNNHFVKKIFPTRENKENTKKAVQIMVQAWKRSDVKAEEKFATSNNLVIRRQDQEDIEGALAGSGIELTATDGGNYYIYNANSSEMIKDLKPVEANMKITAKLTGAAKWIEGSTIVWKIPTNSSMIVSPIKTVIDSKNNITYTVWNEDYLQEEDQYETKEIGGIVYKLVPETNQDLAENNYQIIIRAIVDNTIPYQTYRISEFYNANSNANNMIKCEVLPPENYPEENKKDWEVHDAILLNFGVKGSQGTGYTFFITLEQPYLTLPLNPNVTSNIVTKATAHFLDPSGNEVDFNNEQINFYWGWDSEYVFSKEEQQPLLFLTDEKGTVKDRYEISEVASKDLKEKEGTLYFNSTANYYIYNDKDNSYSKVIDDTVYDISTTYYKLYSNSIVGKTCCLCYDLNAQITPNDYHRYILSATLYNWQLSNAQNITYKAFLPIPIWHSIEHSISNFSLSGPTNVVYNFQGSEPKYLENISYELIGTEGSGDMLINVTMNSISLLNSSKGFGLTEDNKLLVPTLAPSDFPKLTLKIATNYGIYYQPISIIRNQYTSALLNSWNGNMDIDNDNNTILTKIIGAGQKNDRNQFSGVFMGAVGNETNNDATTGLYGYKDGVLRFKFTEKGEGYIGVGSENHIQLANGNFEIKTKKFILDSDKLYLSGDTKKDDKYFNLGNKLTFDGNNLVIEGKIIAKTGEVGGWKIFNSRLEYDATVFENSEYKSGYRTGMQCIYGDNSAAFYAGCKTVSGDTISNENSSNFYVTNAGYVFCNNIKAVGGKISSWQITNTVIGNEFISGIIDSDSVGIAPGINTKTRQISNQKTGGGQEGLCFWAGANWNPDSDDWNKVEISKAPFRVYNDGSLYASNATITGTLKAGSTINDGVYLGSSAAILEADNAAIRLSTTPVSSTNTYSTRLALGRYGNWFIQGYNNTGTFSTSIDYNNGIGNLYGTWKYSGSMQAFTSDINKKNTITTISNEYSILFNNLRPVTYKYNDGTSDRLHIGFIAQEVKQALDIANISTKDFGGLVIFNQGTEEEEWTLRYGEFIALNTWQIQKLKTRVVELETELAEIKEKL